MYCGHTTEKRYFTRDTKPKDTTHKISAIEVSHSYLYKLSLDLHRRTVQPGVFPIRNNQGYFISEMQVYHEPILDRYDTQPHFQRDCQDTDIRTQATFHRHLSSRLETD